MKKVLILLASFLSVYSVLVAEPAVSSDKKTPQQLGGVILKQANETGQLRLKEHAVKSNSSKQKIVVSGGRSTLCRDGGDGVEKCETN